MYQLLQHQQPRLLLHLDYLVHLDLSPGKRTNLSQFIMHITLLQSLLKVILGDVKDKQNIRKEVVE